MAQLTEMTPVVAASQTAFRQHREGLNDLTVDSFMQLPYLFEGDDEAKQQLEHSILQLVQNDVECECLEQALQEVGNCYTAASAAERRDIKLAEKLDDAANAARQAHPAHVDPRTSAVWKKWCTEIGQAIQDDPDDDLQVGAGAEFKNAACPVCAKRIFDLKDPVFDRYEFVYERAAIEDYIKKGRGHAKHPCKPDEMITQGELRTAKRVAVRAAHKKREEAAQRAQHTMGDDEIL